MLYGKLCLVAALGCCALLVSPGCPLIGEAVAGSATANVGVSLTIIAGCSVRNGIGTGPVNVACDNVVPHRVEVHPMMIEVVPENTGEHRELEARNIVIVY
jgi:hypothetical protein